MAKSLNTLGPELFSGFCLHKVHRHSSLADGATANHHQDDNAMMMYRTGKPEQRHAQ